MFLLKDIIITLAVVLALVSVILRHRFHTNRKDRVELAFIILQDWVIVYVVLFIVALFCKGVGIL